MNGPVDINVGIFRETSVSFPKSIVSQLFPKYSLSFVYLNVKNSYKLNSP